MLVSYAATLAVGALMILGMPAIPDWTPVRYFSAEKATVTGSGLCAEGRGTATEPSYCDVSWRLPDSTEGGPNP